MYKVVDYFVRIDHYNIFVGFTKLSSKFSLTITYCASSIFKKKSHDIQIKGTGATLLSVIRSISGSFLHFSMRRFLEKNGSFMTNKQTKRDRYSKNKLILKTKRTSFHTSNQAEDASHGTIVHHLLSSDFFKCGHFELWMLRRIRLLLLLHTSVPSFFLPPIFGSPSLTSFPLSLPSFFLSSLGTEKILSFLLPFFTWHREEHRSRRERRALQPF